ncbi:MAG TPA: hypothetical protein PLK34_02415 [Candidatus Pacearchaeota archaeon]|nr:hypothetical protein [Candidatus Pacearchaeota archaeon]
MIWGDLITQLVGFYNLLMDMLPFWGREFVKLFLMVCIVFTYAFFIWKFYTSLAKKNIFGLNLHQYTGERDIFFVRVLRGVFYILEYLILLPFVIFFWFAVLSAFLILMTNIALSEILMISAVIVVVTRMAAYAKKGELAKELAKLIPFMLLTAAILEPTFFDVQRVISQFKVLPEFFSNAVIYFIFIVILEIILRLFDFILSLFGSD